MDQMDKMMAWENGDLRYEDSIEPFQELVDSGMAWRLQGAYGRTAARMIDAGDVQVVSRV